MSYGIIHQFKGAAKEQYQASAAAVHPSDGTLPAGQLYHFADPSADGWVVVIVHDAGGRAGERRGQATAAATRSKLPSICSFDTRGYRPRAFWSRTPLQS
jgi:hypothetical protein